MLALMLGAGLRRSEVAGVLASAWDGAAVTVIGKGNVERLVPLLAGAPSRVERWTETRREAARMRRARIPVRLPTDGSALDPRLLWRVDRFGRIEVGRGMGDRAITDRLTVRAAEAGLPAITPHDLRRTFCTALLDGGADVLTVRGMMGHASAVTTARYDRRDERAAEDAAALVDLG